MGGPKNRAERTLSGLKQVQELSGQQSLSDGERGGSTCTTE